MLDWQDYHTVSRLTVQLCKSRYRVKTKMSADGRVNPVIHCLAGGLAGTIAATITCPLDVLKTRLQSTVATFQPVYTSPQYCTSHFNTLAKANVQQLIVESQSPIRLGIWQCLRHIVHTEGYAALFKGLGPNLVGIAPSRAIYFCAYANTKSFLNQYLPANTAPVHVGSAIAAGFSSATLTNPIWYIRTHLQLDQRCKTKKLTIIECIQRTYSKYGFRGFYKGLSASYYGTAETVIHFVIYEEIKGRLMAYSNPTLDTLAMSGFPGITFCKCMLASFCSKFCASLIAYPHEVIRTRLRQDGDKYRRFIQTFCLIVREEGKAGLYRGLCTQLVRQIPNTAIMMATYETIVSYYRHGQKESTPPYDSGRLLSLKPA